MRAKDPSENADPTVSSLATSSLRLGLALLLLLSLFPLHMIAEEKPSPYELIPEDPKESWTIGFAAFHAEDISPDYAYLAQSLPLNLVETFIGLPEHSIKGDEEAAYRNWIKEEKIRSLGLSLNNLLKEKGQLFFGEESSKDGLEELEQKIKELQRDIEILKGLDAGLIGLDNPKPVELHSENMNGKLLTLPEFGLVRFMEKTKIDLIVSARLEEISDYLNIRLAVSSRFTGNTLFEENYIAAPEDILQELEVMTDDLSSVLLARQWAALSVRCLPDDAEILLDGKLLGYGEAESRFLKPGRVSLSVRAAGHETLERSLGLMPETRKELLVELEEVEAETFLLLSDPAGADVYLDSVWQGKTPLELEAAPFPRQGLFTMKGYHPSNFVLRPEEGNIYRRTLRRDFFDLGEEMERKKDDFYTALGVFVLSLPFPIVLNGLYRNVVSAFTATSPYGLSSNEVRRLAERGNALYYSYLGTVIVSGTFFVNAVIKLFEYISAGEAFHEY